MKVLDGRIGVVGGGGAARRKSNVLSILEIGEHQLRRIVLPDALREPMTTGKYARILLGRGLSLGLVTRPYIAAIEIDGRKYKTSQVIVVALLKALLYGTAGYMVLSRVSLPLGLIFGAGAAMYYAKDSLDFIRF
jgi:hypothetical protein